MKLSELLKRMPAEILCGLNMPESAPDTEISSIVSDSRKVKKNSLFVCVGGSHYDGHDFADQAVSLGASAVLAERGRISHTMGIIGKTESGIIKPKIPLIETNDTRRALAFLWSAWYNKPDTSFKLIAVTGTNGKTSTAYILREILMSAGFKTGIIGTAGASVGNRVIETDGGSDMLGIPCAMTTPDPEILYSILDIMRNENAEFVIMEASSHSLELKKLDALHFTAGIFTNLSPEHLDFHGDMNRYLAAKSRLFKMTPDAVINADDSYAGQLMKNAPECRYIKCSAGKSESVKFNPDILASDIQLLGADGLEYNLSGGGHSFRVKSRIAGYFTVYNTMLALSCALMLGIDACTAAEAVSKIECVSGRLERVCLDGTGADFSAFIDYAHTQEALEKVLYTVRDFRINGSRLILLFGCGGDRDRLKRRKMGAAASRLADFTIITSDNSRTENKSDIIAEIMRGFEIEKPHIIIKDRAEAIRYAVNYAGKGDIILLAGKGHEKYEIDENGKHPFDEKEILRRAAVEKFKNSI